MVALKYATVRDEYGELEELKAGVTFVYDRNHFLVKTYPDLFAPDAEAPRYRRTQRRCGQRRRTWVL